MDYIFTYNNKEYKLSKENCEGVFWGEDEISNVDLDLILKTLNNSNEVSFSKEYYTGKCQCNEQPELSKSYCYLEYHFYIFTKNNDYVINSICQEYENTSFNRLLSIGKVDNSYIVNVTVCPFCGTYSIEIDQCDV